MVYVDEMPLEAHDIVEYTRNHPREAVEKIRELQAENDKLKEIASLALDIHTRDPLVVSAKWGFTGPKAEELLVAKIEALKG